MTSWLQQKSLMPFSAYGLKYAHVDPPSVECASHQFQDSITFLPLCATAGSLTLEPYPAGKTAGFCCDALKYTALPSARWGAAWGRTPRATVALAANGGGPACTRGSLAGRPFARAAMAAALFARWSLAAAICAAVAGVGLLVDSVGPPAAS